MLSTPDPFAEWIEDVVALPPDGQVKAVAAKLKECNPDFDGKWAPHIDLAVGAVTDLSLSTADVADLNPLRAFRGLRKLTLTSRGTTKGKLTDLSPLKELPLTSLAIAGNPVVDLVALKNMPLISLVCTSTNVFDLSPLHGMKLTALTLSSDPLVDLSPLKGMPLTDLRLSNLKVSDLSPVKGLPLATLYCTSTKVTDLSPLKGRSADHSLLRQYQGLRTCRRCKGCRC